MRGRRSDDRRGVCRAGVYRNNYMSTVWLVRSFYKAIRQCMVEDLLENGATRKIGGRGHIVEIDESKFGKRKYHRGRRVIGKWIVGGYCRTTGECFLVECTDNKRNHHTLLRLIKQHVAPETIILTDKWKGYNALRHHGYRTRQDARCAPGGCARDVPEVCPRCAPGGCARDCARDVPEMCPRCARGVPEMCPRCALCPRCARDVPQVCPRLCPRCAPGVHRQITELPDTRLNMTKTLFRFPPLCPNPPFPNSGLMRVW